MIIKKSDDILQVVYGEVIVAGVLDGQQQITPDIMEVYHAAHNFLKNGNQENVDIQHDGKKVEGAVIVESFVTREDDPVFSPFAWVVGIYLPMEAYQLYLDGQLNGFSPYGTATVNEQDVELVIPDVLEGVTAKAGEPLHDHTYVVNLDDDGKPYSGVTSPNPDDGHVHTILKHTVTELAGDPQHKHHYDIINDLYSSNSNNS